MSIRIPRHARKTAFVCLLLAVVLSFFVRRAAAGADRERRTPILDRTPLAEPTRGFLHDDPVHLSGDLLAFAPLPSARAPATVVYLHGIHGRAKNGCPWMRAGATEVGWLVCPQANVKLPDGAASWGGTAREKAIVIDRAKAAAKAQGATDDVVLVGFSQGAYVAWDLVRAGETRAKALVLLAADVAPTAAELRAAGVSRIVLGAGNNDATFGALARAARRLEAEGFDVRLVDLGHVGHSYVGEDPSVLSDAIAWAGRAP